VAIIILASAVGVGLTMKDSQSETYSNVSSIKLQIFGNANEDDVIDQRDIDYVNGVIDGSMNETDFCDANNDGAIDSDDIDIIKKIINDEAVTLYYVNCDSNIASVNMPVKTIVVAYSNNAEVVRLLNASDMVIGVDDNILKYPKYFPEFQNRTSVGSRFSFDIEEILSLNPDIVFTGTSNWYTAGLEDKLAANGTDISVVRLPTWEYNLVSSTILTMGYILDQEETAYEYITWEANILSEITTAVENMTSDEKVNVFVDRPGSTTVGTGSGYAEILEMAGGINLAKGLTGTYPIVDVEWVLEQEPEYIIGISFSGSYESNNMSLLTTRYDAIVSNYGLTTAVIDDNIHVLHYDIMLGPSYVVGVSYIAKWLYPTLFSDIDPESIHQEFIDRFCGGLDFDVSEEGVFVL
jgi:iron complex transport system substrate-binding protein